MITLLFNQNETPRPWYKKINPLWWFGNDEAAPDSTFVYKYLRNPAQNFRWYVIGFADRPHSVTGRAGTMVTDSGIIQTILNKRSDNRPTPETGFQYSFINGFWPFVSYSSKHFTAYIGWEPRGGFGILVNFSNSDLA